jgi:hypothetical protein
MPSTHFSNWPIRAKPSPSISSACSGRSTRWMKDNSRGWAPAGTVGQHAGPGHGPGNGSAPERRSGPILFRKPAVIHHRPGGPGTGKCRTIAGFLRSQNDFEAFIWGINPFDQFGVELGKVTAGNDSRARWLPAIAIAGHDFSASTPSTATICKCCFNGRLV